MAVSVLAPAKVNLYLHVVGRRDDGYHLLDSLVAFADFGDRVEAAPAGALSLTVNGPEAAAIAELGDDNLVLRAARLLAAEAGGGQRGARLCLEKHLPTSSGIGGGSSDAAACLRALGLLWRNPVSRADLATLAARLGADVPACLLARPVWVGGIGEVLEMAASLPEAGIVIANPRRPLATPAVFRARAGAFSSAARFAIPSDAAGLCALLAERRNDLTDAALSLVPEIARVLDALRALPGALLARMSGSGASCFALFPDRAAAVAAHRALQQAEPSWWSAAGALLAEPPPVIEAAQPEG